MSVDTNELPKDEVNAEVAEQIATGQDDSQPSMDDAYREQLLNTPKRIEEIAKAKTDISNENFDKLWHNILTSLLGRLGPTEENIKYLTELTAPLQIMVKNLAHNAVSLAEMHEHYVNGQQALDIGAKFVMDDFMRGIYNFGFGVLPIEFNIYDPDAPGADDPRWSFDPIPDKELRAAPGIYEIPVRVETFSDIYYGHLTCFAFQIQAPNGKLYTMQTQHPAIRVNKNWITVNSIVRWFQCEDETVKNAWLTGKGHYVKKQPTVEDEPTPTENETVSDRNESNVTTGD